MSTKTITIASIVALIIIVNAWFYFDNGGAKKMEDAYNATSTESAKQYITIESANQTDANNAQQVTNQTTQTAMKNFSHTITIKTNKGTIVFETYDADAPETAKKFVTLANKGFYNGVIFHRVIPGFMIQGGDPTGTGMGGPGYKFADELDPNTPSYKAGYARGTVAMANSGPNTNGSQFFIMHKDYPLPHNYTIFGRVISGMEVVDAIANAERDSRDKPLSDIKMESVTVVNK